MGINYGEKILSKNVGRCVSRTSSSHSERSVAGRIVHSAPKKCSVSQSTIRRAVKSATRLRTVGNPKYSSKIKLIIRGDPDSRLAHD